jgi:hypothetical protein
MIWLELTCKGILAAYKKPQYNKECAKYTSKCLPQVNSKFILLYFMK